MIAVFGGIFFSIIVEGSTYILSSLFFVHTKVVDIQRFVCMTARLFRAVDCLTEAVPDMRLWAILLTF